MLRLLQDNFLKKKLVFYSDPVSLFSLTLSCKDKIKVNIKELGCICEILGYENFIPIKFSQCKHNSFDIGHLYCVFNFNPYHLLKHGELKFFKKMYMTYKPNIDKIFKICYQHDDFISFKFLHKLQGFFPDRCMENTCFYGALNILLYIREEGLDWEKNSCVMAAYSCDIDFMDFIIQEGCPFDLKRMDREYRDLIRNGFDFGSAFEPDEVRQVFKLLDYFYNEYATVDFPDIDLDEGIYYFSKSEDKVIKIE